MFLFFVRVVAVVVVATVVWLNLNVEAILETGGDFRVPQLFGATVQSGENMSKITLVIVINSVIVQ